ncbi:hypothetical protein WJX81_007805 [Elliptochloris bilobata]|uniref:Alcohol dehydrogenase-like N-terminal domain-containing protein n=1 Tax=Elliptochloris bilobata TaxID=381761 RepID=A0AAW1S380_9CHLO
MTVTEKKPEEKTAGEQERETLPGVTIHGLHDAKRLMKAAEYRGKQSIKVIDRPMPLVTDAEDAILKVSSTCICGSDLHLYLGTIPGMKPGQVMGHEFMGTVVEVGVGVKDVKAGDRVVACFDIGCGRCFLCKQGAFSCCEATNPNVQMKELYGHQISGMFGYSQITGGYDGGQAEYVRVPFADVNLLKVPPDMPDEKIVFLSDILPTAWNACEMGDVSQGDVVAIWGCGPVGILTAQCAMFRGAARVIVIDEHAYRLVSVKEGLAKMTVHGPDVGIEAVGQHYAHSLTHKIEMKLHLETDPSEVLNEIIYCTRKAGRISIVGVYAGFTKNFNIGEWPGYGWLMFACAFMEKGQQMRGSQTPVQKFWHHLLELVQSGKLDPSVVVTHRPPLEEAGHAYKVFNEKLENCIKVVLKPTHAPLIVRQVI